MAADESTSCHLWGGNGRLLCTERGAIEGRGRPPRRKLQLLEDVLDVTLRRELADHERRGDLLVPCPLCHELEHLALARGQHAELLPCTLPFVEPVQRVDHQRREVARERRLSLHGAAQRADEPVRRDLLVQEA